MTTRNFGAALGSLSMMRRLPHAGLVVCGLLALAGCGGGGGGQAAPTHAAEPLDYFVAKDLSVVNHTAQPDAVLRIIDDSVSFGKEPTYGTDEGDEESWTVIAACADAPILGEADTVEVAVIPASLVTASVKAKALAGAYREDLACRGVSYRS